MLSTSESTVKQGQIHQAGPAGVWEYNTDA